MALKRQLSIENSVLSYLEGMLTHSDQDVRERAEGCGLKIAADMLNRIHNYYEEQKFCDVTLVVGNAKIKAHKLVLSSSSLYFNGLFDESWKESEQDKIEIRQFDETTVKCILHFVYTGKVLFPSTHVLRILAAADFFQLYELDFLREACSLFLQERVTKDNCSAMLVIAEQFRAVTLKEFLIDYVGRNFYQVSQSEDFIKLPAELLVQILESETLVVDHDEDFLPPPSDQEDFILDFVLKYVSYHYKGEPELDEMLCKLFPSVRLCLLSHKVMEKLCCYVNESNCREAMKLIIEAKECDKDEDKCGKQRVPPRDRYFNTHAYVTNVGPVLRKFGHDETYTSCDVDLFIKGMKIWVRSWDGRPVIGGFQVFYSNGQSPMYGGDDEESDIYEFHLNSGERIVKAEVRSGWMVDHIKFFTNKGRELGPYGGHGGSQYIEQPTGKYGFLSFLCGAVVQTQERFAIAQLKLVWKEFFTGKNDESLDEDDRSTQFLSTQFSGDNWSE